MTNISADDLYGHEFEIIEIQSTKPSVYGRIWTTTVVLNGKKYTWEMEGGLSPQFDLMTTGAGSHESHLPIRAWLERGKFLESQQRYRYRLKRV